MYNGVGLQTPRGSGTAGHVQSNKFAAVKSKSNASHTFAAAVEPTVVANKEIMEHERKRQIELKLAILEEELVDHGYSDKEIAEKIAETRRNLEAVDGNKN